MTMEQSSLVGWEHCGGERGEESHGRSHPMGGGSFPSEESTLSVAPPPISPLHSPNNIMKNITAFQQPALPTYTLTKEPDLLSFISDKHLGLLIPVVSYAILSAFWVWIDSLNIWTEYRLHPTEEMLKRNRITKWECLRGVTVYFIVTGAAGVLLTWGEPMETFSGDEAYQIARLASYLRYFQGAVPIIFSLVGIDSKGLAERQLGPSSTLGGILKGGAYLPVPHHTSEGTVLVSSFMPWETAIATVLYYVVIPTIQFLAAFFIADTW